MPNFELAIQVVLHFEGTRLVNDPNDHGGLTFCGLTQKNYPDFDWAEPTVSKAIAFYQTRLWLAHGFDKIEDPILSTKVFDQFVNFGNVLILQRALALYTPTIKADGILGPKTIATLNSIGPTTDANAQAFVSRLCTSQLNRYRSIIANDPTQIEFKQGWFTRSLWPYLHHESPYLPTASDIASISILS
jgi:lysozyme family protein